MNQTDKKKVLSTVLSSKELSWSEKGMLATMLDGDKELTFEEISTLSSVDEGSSKAIIDTLLKAKYIHTKTTYIVSDPDEQQKI